MTLSSLRVSSPGYALAVGNFNDDEHQGNRMETSRQGCERSVPCSPIEIVVSVPKLENYRGAVEIMNSNLDEYSIQTVHGKQMGEYFGASLCVVDINNDG